MLWRPSELKVLRTVPANGTVSVGSQYCSASRSSTSHFETGRNQVFASKRLVTVFRRHRHWTVSIAAAA